MKHKFLFAICIGLNFLGWGQKVDCEYKVDEFTHDTTASTGFEKLGKHKEVLFVSNLKATMSLVNSTWIFGLKPEFPAIQTIAKGDKVYVKFQDESVLELAVSETSISDYDVNGPWGTFWYNYLSFILTTDQFLQLESKKIMKVRCGYADFETKGNQESVVMEHIRCIVATNKPGKEKKEKRKKRDDLYGN